MIFIISINVKVWITLDKGLLSYSDITIEAGHATANQAACYGRPDKGMQKQTSYLTIPPLWVGPPCEVDSKPIYSFGKAQMVRL